MHESEYPDVTHSDVCHCHTAYRDPMAMTTSAIVTIASRNKQITVPTCLFIGNEFVPSCDSQKRIRSI